MMTIRDGASAANASRVSAGTRSRSTSSTGPLGDAPANPAPPDPARLPTTSASANVSPLATYTVSGLSKKVVDNTAAVPYRLVPATRWGGAVSTTGPGSGAGPGSPWAGGAGGAGGAGSTV